MDAIDRFALKSKIEHQQKRHVSLGEFVEKLNKEVIELWEQVEKERNKK